MGESVVQVGQVRRVGDGFEARLDRLIGHDRNAIWHMLTAPKALAQWLAPGSIELRAGGVVHIDFAESGRTIKSTVLQLDPPRLLEYSWSSGDEPKRPLRWELTATADGTQLVMTLRLPAGEDIAKACAGFDAHLEMLGAALEGVPIGFPVDFF
ncbi:SRPBCC family protein [Mesorhizobium sp. ES1-4]|uniref:SRPBCC family protein n=1 Tax=Mesorhizobium sp. ES1-4 TaxID=2876627 RepID=UPI001CCBB90A|nr:SRPBCC family protein [Mesorhizobium sp. ES1-4]MBZ9798680.1 SRPBCC family protein [Mesorhizobium sp. ES1-4]